MSQTMEFMDAGALLRQSMQARQLSDAEMDGYRAPFPDETFMAGAREFPCLVPVTPEHADIPANLAAWDVLDRWDKPFLTLWCPGDFVLGGLGQQFIDRVPGANGQPHQRFEPGGHFLQDDRGEDVAAALIDWLD